MSALALLSAPDIRGARIQDLLSTHRQMTKTGDAARPPLELDTDSLLDAFVARQREIMIGTIVVLATAGGLFLWRQSELKKADRADQAFREAANNFYAGDLPLAKADLQKMVGRYSGTTAGIQGSMMLAQIFYQDSNWTEGVKVLQTAQGSSAARPFASALEALMAAGYADLKRYDDAAKHYGAASDKAEFGADKDLYRADAARMLVLAGKKDEARKIWADIAAREDSPLWGESHVRLGELDVAVAPKD